jgi:Spy/CpxP family protein refolding chaperone
MKKILTTIATLALSIALMASAMAQDPGPRGGGPGGPGIDGGRRGGGNPKMLQKVEDEVLAKLNLSDKQKAEVKKHREKLEKTLKELKEQGGAGGEARGRGGNREAGGKMKEAMDAYRDGIKAVLNDEQDKQYDKLMKEAMEKARKARGGEGGKPGGGKRGGN